jgi:hypothetical protein
VARRYGSFTPARRQALRRAQLISAQRRRARRKRIAIGAAAGVGVLGVGTLAGTAVVGHKIANFGPKYDAVQSPLISKRVRGNRNPIPKTKGVYKVATNPSGYLKPNHPYLVKRLRPDYDARRRAAYSQSKPIGRRKPRAGRGKYG